MNQGSRKKLRFFFSCVCANFFFLEHKPRIIREQWDDSLAKVQDSEVGDGTTSVTVLAAELLRVSKDPLQIFLFNLLFHV